MLKTRKTVMHFPADEPRFLNWKNYVRAFQNHISLILWSRVRRKSQDRKVVGDMHLSSRQLKSCECPGTANPIEVTVTWTEEIENVEG